MESTLTTPIRTYLAATKPGIVMGNAMTCAAGFAMASNPIEVGSLFTTLLGLSCIVAAGCVSNNLIDRESDAKMARTKNRPLVTGLIAPAQAKLLTWTLALAGTLLLTLFTNLLASSIALFGLFVYLALYSFLKYRSPHATLIGSIAGAVPPVVGYTAVHPHLDLTALMLFLLLVLWQMPHFYAIAIYRQKEYAAASIPVLPLVKGIRTTQIHMLFYLALLIPVSLFFCSFPLSLIWLALSLQGFFAKDTALWARRMFLFSLLVICGYCAAAIF